MTAPVTVYTADEAAHLLKTSGATIRRMLRSGELRGFRVRSEWRVTDTEIQRLTQPTSQRGQSGPAARTPKRPGSQAREPVAVDDWISRKLGRKTAR